VSAKEEKPRSKGPMPGGIGLPTTQVQIGLKAPPMTELNTGMPLIEVSARSVASPWLPKRV